MPSGLLFEGDLSAWVFAATASGLLFEGDLVGVGIAAPTSPWRFSSSSAFSKSNIFANPRLWPSLDESTRRSTSFEGVGVAMGSPVAVRITPFMADATGNAGGAKGSAGVSKGRRVGRVGETILERGVLCGSLVVNCASGARMFFTSSSGVFSFFRPVCGMVRISSKLSPTKCTLLLAFFDSACFFFDFLFHSLELVQLGTPMCLQFRLACRAHCDLISLPRLEQLCLSYVHGLHDLFFPPLEAQLDHLFVFEYRATQFFFAPSDCLLYLTSNGRRKFSELSPKGHDFAVFL
jgi:hypothetical protein